MTVLSTKYDRFDVSMFVIDRPQLGYGGCFITLTADGPFVQLHQSWDDLRDWPLGPLYIAKTTVEHLGGLFEMLSASAAAELKEAHAAAVAENAELKDRVAKLEGALDTLRSLGFHTAEPEQEFAKAEPPRPAGKRK